MKTAGKRFLMLIGLAVNLFYTSCSQAQYGRSYPSQPYPPTNDRPDYGYGQPGYDQSGYDEYYNGDFYDDLSPYGQWVRTPEYGMVWIPNAEPGFQPYASNGRWVITEFGNTWVSDYTWGWAPFHYGRWYQDRYNRWAWVPGREWGPAWVSWRTGGGYYGWAPLGPGVNINVNINTPPSWWSFVPQMYITSPRLYSYCVPRHQVVNVYQNTTIINNVYRVNNRAYAYGPRREEIEYVTRRSVPVYRIENAGRPGRDEVRQNTIGIYRPEAYRNRNPRDNDYGRNNGNGGYNRNNGDHRNNNGNGGYNRDNNGYNRDNGNRPNNRPDYRQNNGTYNDNTPPVPPTNGSYPQRDPARPGNSNDRRQRYEAPSQPSQPTTPQVQPERPLYQQPQPNERLETVPQNGPGFGRRGSGGGYTPRENNGPGFGQGQQQQPNNQPPHGNSQPQEQRMRNYERKAQEAEQNMAQPQTNTPAPGNGGRSRGPR